MTKIKYIILVLCMFLVSNVKAQYYASFVPSITNSNGTFLQKSNLSIEFGKQWDCFSLGVALGKTTLSKDTAVGDPYTTVKSGSSYVELRPNLNIFQQGKFTNTITFGIGTVFNSHESLMTEITNGIEYAYTPLIHINIYFGQFYYDGEKTNSTTTFFGVSIMKFFTPYHPTSIINNEGK